MAHAVFLRAANVGGKNVFRPAHLAASLGRLEVVNVGAAGTFVVRGQASAATIRRAIREELPFDPEIAVYPAKDVVDLVRSAPFRGVAFSKDVRGWAAALMKRPKARPELPLEKPSGKAWSVRFDRVVGGFALGLWRRQAKGFVFPNEVVESALDVPATTRYWETLERVAALLEA